MSRHACFLGCDPPAGGGAERFFTVHGAPAFGHTFDAWEQANFPDEHQVTLRERARGVEFACWHSAACPDGEPAAYALDELRPVTYEEFTDAGRAGWPQGGWPSA